MANGKLNKRLVRAAKKALGGPKPKPEGRARLKRILGMRQHPTAAGQAQFGRVDVTGAQTTQDEIRRANRQTPIDRYQTGAQMTEDEIERANKKRPIGRYLRGTRR